MKYTVLSASRRLGVLAAMDAFKFVAHRLRVSSSNTRFRKLHPEFPVPPEDLAFDAFNSIDWYRYRELGLKHAGCFADIINRYLDTGQSPARVLEWGCGPGRLIRHMPELLRPEGAQLFGSDYNPLSIAWCEEALPKVSFAINQSLPPLVYTSDYFDATYNFSVMTHLSIESQRAWAKELYRVLRPGGVLVTTTHGENYTHLMTSRREREAFAAGEPVIQAGYSEGKKWYLSLHPDRFVRDTLLAEFVDVEKIAVDPEHKLLQDVWVARKPDAPTQEAVMTA
jgi:SAM-dependent methyltransferase